MQAPGAGDSMLQVMIAFGVYLGFQLINDAAEFPEPSRWGHGRKPALTWCDAEAPASWQPLLAARDKAAEWYVARAMPRTVGGGTARSRVGALRRGCTELGGARIGRVAGGLFRRNARRNTARAYFVPRVAALAP